ncbi:glycoside hydrolase superfamily [Tricladium varicosporioides]|nr:glycoside hydrolase superfamily [Hymenoscyphus varicosporioides]
MLIFTALLSLAGLVVSLPATEDITRIPKSPSDGRLPPKSVPSVDGLKFNISGTTSYFAGTNAYWAAFTQKDSDIEVVMQHLNTSGLKVLRVWGFNDVSTESDGVWFQSFVSGQPPKINNGLNGLSRLDYVVSRAEVYGIKLIINFVNNWKDYGGMPLYNSYYGTSEKTWYTDSKVQAQYQTYVKTVVNRLRNSSAIFAWELANEPRCKGCPTSVITSWATKTAAFIKSLDPLHMITLGDEGFLNGGGDKSYPYTTAEGIDFEANLKIPDISFGTFHMYPTSCKSSSTFHLYSFSQSLTRLGGVTGKDWGSTWFSNHGAICAAIGKPCIAEEYGATSNKAATIAPWQATSMNTKGIAGDMYWQYGDTLRSGQKTPDDGYTIYYNSSDYNALVTNHVAAINKIPESA